MYSPGPRPILKRHDPSSSPSNASSHINNTAANTISNSHYSHYPSPRSYAQNHHNYTPRHAIPNHTTAPVLITSSTNTTPSSRSCTVHFPPSPALTSTFACHSSTVYDRSPIVVAPNTCALPERGCPGRTYALGGEEEEEADEYDNCVSTSPKKEKRKTKTVRDRDFHPRALAFAAASASSTNCPSFGAPGGSSSSFSSFALPPAATSGTSASSSYTAVSLSAAYYNYSYDHAPVPALVHDLSSESDESDGVSGLPAQITGYMSAMSLNMSVSVSPTKACAGSPTRVQIAVEGAEERDGRKEKAHRRHRSRERVSRHERSSDPDRIPGLAAAVPSSPIPFSTCAPPASHFAPSSPPPFASASPPAYCSSSSSPRKKGVRRSYPTASGSLGLGCGGFGAQEEGCLGGF